MTRDTQKPPRNRDQKLPPRKGDSIEHITPPERVELRRPSDCHYEGRIVERDGAVTSSPSLLRTRRLTLLRES